ncbi:MAG: CFI-box-CTERM domain-containing protein [Thermoproteota archaeon]
MRRVIRFFKCLCGRGPPKPITIRYGADKNGYSEGLLETDERELPPDTPVEAEEKKPGFRFISTVVYEMGSETSLELLKGFRDDLMLNSIGRRLVNWYCGISPPIAQKIAGSEKSKTIVRRIVDLAVALIKRRNAEDKRVLKAICIFLIVQAYVLGCLVAKVLSVFSTK